MAQVRTRWRDPATWRDVAYLIGLWPLLFVLDTAVLTVWLTLLAGVSLPAWYWAPRGNVGPGLRHGAPVHGVALGYFPHGAARPRRGGLYVDTMPRALLAGAVFLVAFLLFNYVVVVTARAHARSRRPCCARPPTRWPGSRRCSPARARSARCTQLAKTSQAR